MVLMMKTSKKYLPLVLVLGINFYSFGQESTFQYANRQFELTNYRIAADEYAKYYSSNPSYGVAHKTASALDSIYAFSESYTWWKTVVSFSEATKLDFASLVRAGHRSIKDYQPSADLSGSPYSEKDFEEFSASTPSSGKLIQISGLEAMDLFNTAYSDYSLSKGKTGLYFFSSNRGTEAAQKKSGIRFDVKGNGLNKNHFNSDGKNYYKIYSSKSNEEPKQVQVDGFELYHLSDPYLLSNGIIVFAGTPNKQANDDVIIYPGIFYGKFDSESNSVSEIKSFPINQTNSFGVISPSVDEKENRLYFASNRPGGTGGYDIYYVTIDNEMNFSDPVNLGATINTAFNERDGFRYGDEFYFSSDRTGGVGGLDIYSAALKNNKFGEVGNLGKSINSVADDFGFFKISSTEAYLSSDRITGIGSDDIYSVLLKKRNLVILLGSSTGALNGGGPKLELVKNKTSNDLAGSTRNQTGDLLNKENAIDPSGKSEAEVISLLSNGKAIDVTGETNVGLIDILEDGESYTIAAKKPGYFDQVTAFTFSNTTEQLKINLSPIPFDLTAYEAIIYYDLDKDFLRDLSKEKLDEITAYLSKHPELNLVIESHTDSRASVDYNEKLSERRAKSVIQYLEKKGVSSSRISAKWFNEEKLVTPCGDGVPCPETDHQLNRRSELKLIAFPDPNQSYPLPKGATATDFQSREAATRWFLKK